MLLFGDVLVINCVLARPTERFFSHFGYFYLAGTRFLGFSGLGSSVHPKYQELPCKGSGSGTKRQLALAGVVRCEVSPSAP